MTMRRFYEETKGPWCHFSAASPRALCSLAWRLRGVSGEQSTGISAFSLRGRKMRTLDGLFDEFSAAMQFPYYFGENWPAFDECIADLEWVTTRSVVVLIDEAPCILADDRAEKETFWTTLGATARERRTRLEQDERGPSSLHVVLGGMQRSVDASQLPIRDDELEWVGVDDEGNILA